MAQYTQNLPSLKLSAPQATGKVIAQTDDFYSSQTFNGGRRLCRASNGDLFYGGAYDFNGNINPHLWYSTDDGQTWTRLYVGKGDGSGSTEMQDGMSVAIDSQDKVHIFYSDWTGTSSSKGLYYSRVDAATKTVELRASGISLGSTNAAGKAAAVDSGDNLYVTFMQVSRYVYFTKSTDGGSTWSTPVALNSANSGDLNCIVDTNERIHACWVDNNAVRYRYSDDLGSTWSSTESVSGNQPSMGVDLDGNVHMFSRVSSSLTYYKRTNSWSGATTLSTGSVNKGSVSIDIDNNVYVLYNKDATRNRIMLRKSTDGGSTWSTETAILDDETETEVYDWPDVMSAAWPNAGAPTNLMGSGFAMMWWNKTGGFMDPGGNDLGFYLSSDSEWVNPGAVGVLTSVDKAKKDTHKLLEIVAASGSIVEPVHHFKMNDPENDDDQDPTLVDAAGNSNATLYQLWEPIGDPSPAWDWNEAPVSESTGPRSMGFYGNNNYATIDNPSAIKAMSTPLTVSFWCKYWANIPSSNDQVWLFPFGTDYVGGSPHFIVAIYLAKESNGDIYLGLYGYLSDGVNSIYIGHDDVAVSPTFFDPEAWHHYSFIFDSTGGQSYIYVDGQDINNYSSRTALDISLSGQSNDFFFQNNSLSESWETTNMNSLQFWMDDFRLYDKKLTEAEIGFLYNDGAGTEEDLVPLGQSTEGPITLGASSGVRIYKTVSASMSLASLPSQKINKATGATIGLASSFECVRLYDNNAEVSLSASVSKIVKRSSGVEIMIGEAERRIGTTMGAALSLSASLENREAYNKIFNAVGGGDVQSYFEDDLSNSSSTMDTGKESGFRVEGGNITGDNVYGATFYLGAFPFPTSHNFIARVKQGGSTLASKNVSFTVTSESRQPYTFYFDSPVSINPSIDTDITLERTSSNDSLSMFDQSRNYTGTNFAILNDKIQDGITQFPYFKYSAPGTVFSYKDMLTAGQTKVIKKELSASLGVGAEAKKQVSLDIAAAISPSASKGAVKLYVLGAELFMNKFLVPYNVTNRTGSIGAWVIGDGEDGSTYIPVQEFISLGGYIKRIRLSLTRANTVRLNLRIYNADLDGRPTGSILYQHTFSLNYGMPAINTLYWVEHDIPSSILLTHGNHYCVRISSSLGRALWQRYFPAIETGVATNNLSSSMGWIGPQYENNCLMVVSESPSSSPPAEKALQKSVGKHLVDGEIGIGEIGTLVGLTEEVDFSMSGESEKGTLKALSSEITPAANTYKFIEVAPKSSVLTLGGHSDRVRIKELASSFSVSALSEQSAMYRKEISVPIGLSAHGKQVTVKGEVNISVEPSAEQKKAIGKYLPKEIPEIISLTGDFSHFPEQRQRAKIVSSPANLTAEIEYNRFRKTRAVTSGIEQYTYPINSKNIARDSQGTLYIVHAKNVGSYRQLHISKSRSGGRNWTETRLETTDLSSSAYPTIVIDSSDNLHVMWYGRLNTSYPETLYKKYTKATESWGNTAELTSNGALLTNSASLAIDGNDDLHMIQWVRTALVPAKRQIVYMKSTDGGDSWSPPLEIYGNFPTNWDHDAPTLAIDGNNNLHVVFYGQYPVRFAGPLDLWHTVSSDSGVTWADFEKIYTSGVDQRGAYYPQLNVDLNDNLHLSFITPADETMVSNYNQGAYMRYASGAWSSPHIFLIGNYHASRADCGIDANGKVHIAFGSKSASSTDFDQIYNAVSNDNGITWGNLLRRTNSGGYWSPYGSRLSPIFLNSVWPKIGGVSTNILPNSYAYVYNEQWSGRGAPETRTSSLYYESDTWMAMIGPDLNISLTGEENKRIEGSATVYANSSADITKYAKIFFEKTEVYVPPILTNSFNRQASSQSAGTVSIPYETPAGDNRALIVVSGEGDPKGGYGITYNGVPLSVGIDLYVTGVMVRIHYLLNPPVGTHNLNITYGSFNIFPVTTTISSWNNVAAIGLNGNKREELDYYIAPNTYRKVVYNAPHSSENGVIITAGKYPGQYQSGAPGVIIPSAGETVISNLVTYGSGGGWALSNTYKHFTDLGAVSVGVTGIRNTYAVYATLELISPTALIPIETSLLGANTKALVKTPIEKEISLSTTGAHINLIFNASITLGAKFCEEVNTPVLWLRAWHLIRRHFGGKAPVTLVPDTTVFVKKVLTGATMTLGGSEGVKWHGLAETFFTLTAEKPVRFTKKLAQAVLTLTGDIFKKIGYNLAASFSVVTQKAVKFVNKLGTVEVSIQGIDHKKIFGVAQVYVPLLPTIIKRALKNTLSAAVLMSSYIIRFTKKVLTATMPLLAKVFKFTKVNMGSALSLLADVFKKIAKIFIAKHTYCHAHPYGKPAVGNIQGHIWWVIHFYLHGPHGGPGQHCHEEYGMLLYAMMPKIKTYRDRQLDESEDHANNYDDGHDQGSDSGAGDGDRG